MTAPIAQDAPDGVAVWLRVKMLEGPGDVVTLARAAHHLAPHIREMIAATRREERARIAALLRARADELEAQKAVIAPKMLREAADDIERGEP